MKLYLNRTSPYARLALVTAHEKGLADTLELVWVDPWAATPDYLTLAPLARVPLLVTDAGETIPDSACICDYFDQIGKGRALLPPMPQRAGVFEKYGLGRGIIELAFGATIERRFHEGEKQPLAERWLTTVGRVAAHLERRAETLEHGAPDLGDLCIAVGLSYAAFRLPQIAWQAMAPNLAAWQSRIESRSSLRSTAPA